MIRKYKQKLPGISPAAWEHPADRAALSALQQVPMLDAVIRFFMGGTVEQSLRLATLASAVRVTERQFSRVHVLLREACDVLDVEHAPELYVAQSPFLNAGAIGVKEPFIVLNSSLIPSLTDEEVQAIIAHELGHCLSGHVLYKTLLNILLRVSLPLLGTMPFSGAALMAVIAALREWDRKSELSADRAGLLVTQDPNVAYTLLMKMSGGSDVSQIEVNEFFRQAAEYDAAGSLSNSLHKFLNTLVLTHPFPVLRLTAIKSWVDAGAYFDILNGSYTRRGEESHDLGENFRQAAQSYKEDFSNSNDPLAGIMNNAIETAEELGNKAKEKWEELMKKRK